MPRKKNRRKEIQKSNAVANPKPKPRKVAVIAHGASGLAQLALAFSILHETNKS